MKLHSLTMALVSLLFLIGCGGSDPVPQPKGNVSQLVSAASNTTATIASPSGSKLVGASISIGDPSADLPGNATFKIDLGADADTTALMDIEESMPLERAGPTVEFTATDAQGADVTFLNPITITVPYKMSEIPEGRTVDDLILYRADDAQGTPEEVAIDLRGTNSVTATVDHFSIYWCMVRPRPRVHLQSVMPATGLSTGGTAITLKGFGFTDPAVVTIGGNPATNVVVVNGTTITCDTPVGTIGNVDVTVETNSRIRTRINAFTYTLPPLSITTANLPAALTGVNYGPETIAVQGGEAPYTFDVAVGSTLPNGLVLSGDGVFTGVPAAGSDGVVSFDIVVTDNLGSMAVATIGMTIVDGVAPGAINDLALTYAGVTDKVALTFTATGDDADMGGAANYIIKRSTNDILDEADFNAATTVSVGTLPMNSGGGEDFDITLAWESGVHFIALRAADEAGNLGPISNVVMADTDSAFTLVTTPIDFGNVLVNQSAMATRLISSTNPLVDLVLQSVGVVGGSNIQASAGTLPVSLAPGMAQGITLTFMPTSVGAVSGMLSISHSGLGSPTSIDLSGNGTNAAPSVVSAMPNSDPRPAGGQVTLTVEIADGNNVVPNINDIASVMIDLSNIGGSSTAAASFLDMQPNGNVRYQVANYTIPSTTAQGATTLPFSVTDSAGATATGNISLTILGIQVSAPQIVSVSHTPDPSAPGTPVTFEIVVSDGDSNLPTTDDIVSVSLNLANVGGSDQQAMTPDMVITATSRRYVFTYALTGVPTGTYSSGIVVTDSNNGSTAQNFQIVVSGPAGAPVINSAVSSPVSVVSGGNVDLTATVSHPNNNFSLNIGKILFVRLDLSAFGGSAIYNMAVGAVVNNTTREYTHTFSTTGMSSGSYLIPLTVTDVNGAIATGSFSVVVAHAPTLSSPSLNPVSVAVGQTSSLSVLVQDLDSVLPGINDIASVTVDLSAIGGIAAQSLAEGGVINPTARAYTHTVDTNSATPGTYTLPITATDTHGLTANTTVMLTVSAANVAPTLAIGTATPASVTVGASSTLAVVVTDTNSSLPGTDDVSGVTINLSSAGGAASQAMVSGAQQSSTSRSYSFAFNTTGVAPGSYTFPITATDSMGAMGSGSVMLTVSAANVAPTITSVSASPAPAVLNYTSIVTAVIADVNSALPGSDDVASVTINLSAIGGGASQAMASGSVVNATSRNYTFTVNTLGTTPGTFMLPVTATDMAGAMVTSNLSFTISNSAPTLSMAQSTPSASTVGSSVMLSVSVTDVNSNHPLADDISTVRVDLTSIGGSAVQPLMAGATGGATTRAYSASVSLALATPGSYMLPVTATDINGLTGTTNIALMVTAANVAPTLAAGTATPSSVTAGASSTLAVVVTDANSSLPGTDDVSSVTINLSSAGGSAAQAMAAGSQQSTTSRSYSFVFNTTGVTPGSYTFPITATDSMGAMGSGSVMLTVTSAAVAPTVGSATASPASVQLGENVIFTVMVSDANGAADLASVSADLSALGLSSGTPLTQMSMAGNDATYTLTISTFGMNIGTYSLPVTVTDAGALSGSASIALTIADIPPFGPEVLYEYPATNSGGTGVFGGTTARAVFVMSEAPDAATLVNSTGQGGNPGTIYWADQFTRATTHVIATGLDGLAGRILVVQPSATMSSGFGPTVGLFAENLNTGVGIADAAGNRMALDHNDATFTGITNLGKGPIFRWANVSSVDSTSPTLMSSTPSNAGTSGGPRRMVRLTFNEIINPATVAANFSINDGMGALTGSLTVDVTNMTDVLFTPSRDYSGTVTVTYTGIQDLSANSATGSISFTTSTDTIAPVISFLTINEIPGYLNGSAANGGASPGGGKLRLPPTGFTIDLTINEQGGAGINPNASGVSITSNTTVGGNAPGTNLAALITAGGGNHVVNDGEAHFLIPSTLAFPISDSTITVSVMDRSGNVSVSKNFTFECVTASASKLPFDTQDIWRIVYDSDWSTVTYNFAGNNVTSPAFGNTVLADGTSDFEQALTGFGIRSASGTGLVNGSATLTLNDATTNWMKNRIHFHLYRYFGMSVPLTQVGTSNPYFASVPVLAPTNPADGVNIRFQESVAPHTTGVSRISIGGITTMGTLGRALYDVQNDDHNEDNGVVNALSGGSRLGVFIQHEINEQWDGTAGGTSSTFAFAYHALSPFASANGTPIGDDAADAIVLSPTATPSSFTGPQMTRYKEIMAVMDRLAIDMARITAHEIGHSIGLIEDGAPGAGIYGNQTVAFPGSTTHHIELDSYYPGTAQNIMSPGGSLRHGLSRYTAFNELVRAYLLEHAIYGN